MQFLGLSNKNQLPRFSRLVSSHGLIISAEQYSNDILKLEVSTCKADWLCEWLPDATALTKPKLIPPKADSDDEDVEPLLLTVVEPCEYCVQPSWIYGS